MGCRSNLDERITPFRRLTILHYFIVIGECVAFPVGRTTHLTGTASVLEAGEEVIDLGLLIPPDRDQVTQRPRRPIRVALANERGAANPQSPVRCPVPSTAMG